MKYLQWQRSLTLLTTTGSSFETRVVSHVRPLSVPTKEGLQEHDHRTQSILAFKVSFHTSFKFYRNYKVKVLYP